MKAKLTRFETLTWITLALTRIAWPFLSRTTPEDFQDASEYIELSTRALHGNLDFDLYRFIRPPGYPLLIALTRKLFDSGWISVLVIENVFFSIATGVLIYLLTQRLTSNRVAATGATLIYATNGALFYFVPVIASESMYAFFVLLTLYLFYRFLDESKNSLLIAFSTSCYLTTAVRSQMLVVLPVFAFVLLTNYATSLRSRIRQTLIFLVAFALLATPLGLVNLKKHGSFIISSNGGSFLFLNGNSIVGYLDGTQYHRLSLKEQDQVKNFYENGTVFFGPDFERISALGQKEKQREFTRLAFAWIKAHPMQFLELKLRNIGRLLLPGTSWTHTSFWPWLVSVIAGLPLYVLSMIGIVRVLHLQDDQKRRYTALFGYLVASSAPLVVLLYTHRYRVYSLDLVMTVFSGIGLSHALARAKLASQRTKSA